MVILEAFGFFESFIACLIRFYILDTAKLPPFFDIAPLEGTYKWAKASLECY